VARDASTDQHFAPEEELYRRFPPGLWDGVELRMDAIQMPDMSVNRSKYSVPRDAVDDEEFAGWGVASFMVKDIPPEFVDAGVHRWSFRPVHDPRRFKHKLNYAHTEVRGYLNQTHFQGIFPPHIHLRFRRRLLQRTRVRIRPESLED
jgi:hypothetical protein